PNGDLICGFCEGSFQQSHTAAMTFMRSSDHGLTWSGPTIAPAQRPLINNTKNSVVVNAIVKDPDTGHMVEAFPFFDRFAVDHTNGNLYAVWLDARFSNMQVNSIALSMSTDGGLTWSSPIQINKTPTNIP